jgi:membrane protein required for colicin V production
VNAQALLGRLTWLDWILVLVVLGSVVQGARRGFARALVDLISSLIAVAIALAALPQASAWVLRYLPITPVQAQLLALFGVVIVVRLLFSLVLGLGFGGGLGLPARGAGALLGALGGALAGLVQGLVIAALALVPFVAMPVLPEVTGEIPQSQLAPRLVAWWVVSEVFVETLAGHPGSGPLSELSQPRAGASS